MPTLTDLRPGDLAFGPIHGGAGAVVAAGQIAVAPWKHQLTWKTWWRVRHVGVITKAASEAFAAVEWADQRRVSVHGIGPMMVQAMPGGAETIELGPEHWTGEWTFIRPQYAALSVGSIAQPGQSQADAVALAARLMAERKIPYNWLDYQAIVNHRLHLPGPWLDGYVSAVDKGGVPIRAICSQLADAALTEAGFHPFDDGRRPGDVVPAELYLRLLELGPELIIRPGVNTETAAVSDAAARQLPRAGGYSVDHWL